MLSCPAKGKGKIMKRYSQYGQDTFVGDVLFSGRSGVFVDVGARDGVKLSNSYYLEKELSWTGIAIEPHPDLFHALERSRSCRCLNVAASDVARDGLEFVKFLEEPFGNSGLLSTFLNPQRLKKVKHEIISVPCVPLSQLITDFKVIHYLDIDVEGHELQVLKGIDFAQVEIRILGVEAIDSGPRTESIDQFLAGKGFSPFLHLRSDRFYCQGSVPPSVDRLRDHMPELRLAKTEMAEVILTMIPEGSVFILVDEEQWGAGEFVFGRRRIPFLEKDGQYWGPPADDATAVRECERLRQSGASFIVFPWHTFWWLNYYKGFHQYLRSKFPCLLQNERLVIFDLRK